MNQGNCLNPHVQFTDPQETAVGRETFLKAAKGFSAMFKTLTIRAKFGSKDQAMIVYDIDIPGLAKKLCAASLLSFQGGLISKIELIYDTQCLKGNPEGAVST